MDENKFELNGKTYTSAEEQTPGISGCLGCAFKADGALCEVSPPCWAVEREDGIEVIFLEHTI